MQEESGCKIGWCHILPQEIPAELKSTEHEQCQSDNVNLENVLISLIKACFTWHKRKM